MNVEDPLHEYGRWCKPVLEDGETGKQYEGALEVMDLLNSFNDENEKLKQFKENVIKWVDSQMKFNVKKYIETEDCYFKSENIDLYNFKVFIGIDSDD